MSQELKQGVIVSFQPEVDQNGQPTSFHSNKMNKDMYPHVVTVKYVDGTTETQVANSLKQIATWKLNTQCTIKRNDYDGRIKLGFDFPRAQGSTSGGYSGGGKKGNDNLLVNRTSTISLKMALLYIKINKVDVMSSLGLTDLESGDTKNALVKKAMTLSRQLFAWIVQGANDDDKWQRFNAVECTMEAIEALNIKTEEGLMGMCNYFLKQFPLKPLNVQQQPTASQPATKSVQSSVPNTQVSTNTTVGQAIQNITPIVPNTNPPAQDSVDNVSGSGFKMGFPPPIDPDVD